MNVPSRKCLLGNLLISINLEQTLSNYNQQHKIHLSEKEFYEWEDSI
jgi:hypothetical protein